MTDPYNALNTLQATFAEVTETVERHTQHLSETEREAAMFAVVAAFSLAQEMWIFKADPARPAFTDWMANGRKTAGDSPYTVYLSTPVSARFSYRLSGVIGQPTYFGLQLYKQVHGFNAQSGVMPLDAIAINPDGSFEVFISKERPAGAANWLPLADDDYILMTREYRYDPVEQTPVSIAIERNDDAPSAAIPLVQRVEKAAAYFKSIVYSTIEIAALLPTNAFAPPDAEVRTPKYGDSLFPTKATFYDGFFVSVKPGEAIKMTGRLPEKWTYVSFVFYDRWYASLNYPRVRCYLTGRDLQFNPDGTYTIYMAVEDPGHPNWIQMGDLSEGLFSYRYMLADSNPKPEIEIVRI